MKKIFWMFILIIFLKLGFKVNASDYYFVWENTTVEVPLFGNISEYQYIPIAKLYCNNKKIENTNISYLRTGEGLYLMDDVDTTKVGKYQVMYKAFEYEIMTGNCDGYNQLITFNVVDTEPPKINILKKEIIISYKVKEYDYTSMITITDNANVEKYTIDDTEVKYGQVGEYNLYVYASDGYNLSKEEFLVKIVDVYPPSIEFCYNDNILNIEYEENLKINFHKYFKAIDDYDGNVIQSLKVSNYDTKKLGLQEVNCQINDSSFNKTTYQIYLNIIDTKKPVIELESSVIEIKIEEMESIDYLSFVKKVEDNMSNLSINDISCTGTVLPIVGEYELEFSVKDESFNETKEKMLIVVKSGKAPIIKTNNPTIKIGTNINILDYIEISDPSDENVVKTFKVIKSNLDINKKGTYYVSFCVNNSSGMFSYGNLIISVIEENEKRNFNAKTLYIVIGSVLLSLFFLFNKKSRRKS